MSAYRKNFRLYQRLSRPRGVLMEDLSTGTGVAIEEDEVRVLGMLYWQKLELSLWVECLIIITTSQLAHLLHSYKH